MTRSNCRYESDFCEGVLEFRLLGEIDHHSAVNIRTAMDAEICELRPKKVIIELCGIDFMDSSGLGLIMGRYALVQKMGGILSLRSPNERILKILELAGVMRIIGIETEKKTDKEKEKKDERK